MKAKMLKSELNFPLLTLYQLVQEINPISTKGYRLCLHNNTGTHGFSDLPTALITHIHNIAHGQSIALCVHARDQPPILNV